ncbi:MAG: GTP 3',8-cyclase MoaA [Ruminococcaceae bacterium]|nr:GTP 3',8-cyclase MoaA [Oscillospiraceae bacterium]
MKDRYGREIDYLRISLTDLCNLRCIYCMPPEGISKLQRKEILTFEEIIEIVTAAASLGITKLRLTGGEPLVRRGVTELIRALRAIPGIRELTLTTNGLLLPEMAQDLKAAGLSRVNISLDTLNAEKYSRITRLGTLDQALNGIRAAQQAGLSPIKINTVLLGGINDDEIPALVDLTREHSVELRFIELMPIGCVVPFGPEAYIPASTVLERVPALQPLENARSGVAQLYALPNAPGRVGLISPLSCSFCSECNRIRLTADGYLKPCLHSDKEILLRGKHGDALTEALKAGICAKPQAHSTLSANERSDAGRNMNEIGG